MIFAYLDKPFYCSPELSGGGDTTEVETEASEAVAEPGSEPAEDTTDSAAEEAAFYGTPEIVSAAAQWQPPQQTQQPQYTQSAPGWSPQPHPAPQYPPQQPSPQPTQMPPLPDTEIWTTDPARASSMIVEHMNAQQAPLHQNLTHLQSENARLNQMLSQRGQQMDADIQNRNIGLIQKTSKVVNENLYGTKERPGIFNRSPEYASDESFRSEVDGFVSRWISSAAQGLMNSKNPEERARAERHLQWTQDPTFPGKVLALVKKSENIETYQAVGIKGAHQTDGSPHSAPSGPRLSPEDAENARISGLDPKDVAAARKLEQSSLL